MFQQHLHRHDDVNLVMSALGGDPKALPVLITLGTALRHDVASALREIIATGAWTADAVVRRAAVNWKQQPRFDSFFDRDFERRRDRGPKREHLDAALSTAPETRAALYRVWAAECPQHCRTQTGDYDEERHLQNYRQALFGWYAAIQHAHEAVVTAAHWFNDADGRDPRRPHLFGDWLVGASSHTSPHSRGVAGPSEADRQAAARELLLMLDAWSPHTFRAIDVAFSKADGEKAFHSWGAAFEPAGRQEAQDAAEALAHVLTPDERHMIRDLITGIEADQDDRGSDLAKNATMPCTSALHHTYRSTDGDGKEREECAKARVRVYQEATQPWTQDIDRAADARHLARFLLGTQAERIATALAQARSGVPKDFAEQGPQLWHDNAKTLADTRAQAGLDQNTTARILGIKPATLNRFEQSQGKLPGRPAALRYLQLIVLTCIHNDLPVPDCLPVAISQPVTALPTTP
ncbi:helix-turn-helix domain-containing protein [Streptomyces sp. NPDC012769]|uniref:helix-turn-helix domain-containing protein n=1 Tax=Streptomyces sp. NPDC012769 TaxID=3364848 RepID=UPI0036CDF64A